MPIFFIFRCRLAQLLAKSVGSNSKQQITFFAFPSSPTSKVESFGKWDSGNYIFGNKQFACMS